MLEESTCDKSLRSK